MAENNQRKSGAVLSYILIIINTAITVLYTPFLISKLGQSEYGLYSLVNSIIGYLTILDLGFGNAIVVYTTKYRINKKIEEEKKLHGMFFRIFCILGIIAGILGLILYFNVNNLFGNTMTLEEISKAKVMMLILSFNLVITFPFSIYSSIINAYEKFIFQKIMSLLNTLLKPFIMIPLLFLGYKSITLTIVITLINIFVLTSNYLYCRKKLNIKIRYQGFDKKIFKNIFGYSIFIFLGIIVDKINWSIDQIILGAVSGTIAVSIYSVSAQLNNLFINLSTAISSVLLPKMSQMIATDVSTDELTEELIKVGRLQYYIIFIMASGLTLFGKKFIDIWVGPKFLESYYVALILIIPLCLPLIQNLGLSILQAMNKYKFKAISSIIMAIINLILSIILAKAYGAIGAAIGTAISLIIGNIVIMNIYYYKVIKLDVLKFWKEIILLTQKFILPLILGIIIVNTFNMNNTMQWIFGIILYTIIYIINAYFACLNEYEKKLLNKTLRKLHLKKGV